MVSELGDGTFGFSLPLVLKVLTHGTGHFSFTMGALGSVCMSAAARDIVTYTSSSIGFISLGVMGSVSIALMSFVNVNPVEEPLSELDASVKEGDALCVVST